MESSLLIKPQHIIIYYNKIFKTTLEVQILSDMFWLTKVNNKNSGTGNEESVVVCKRGSGPESVTCYDTIRPSRKE
jgi:hypothetical protein